MTNSTLNLGILAHVDAGKTSLTEQLLFHAGAIRNMGSVDKGTSNTDHLKVERERGISVRSAIASFNYNHTKINLIDTPGHIDFSAEVEYCLRAMDAVILVISAKEGVQGHTITLYEAIKRLKLPCIIFVNKIDRAGVDTDETIHDIKRFLTSDIILMQQVHNTGNNQASITPHLWQDEANIEQVIAYDDQLLEKYLDDQHIEDQQLEETLKTAIASAKLSPIMMGAAKNGEGITELLDAMVKYLPHYNHHNQEVLSALVFKIEYDHTLGKMCYVRVFNGSIHPRETLSINHKNHPPQKAGQLKTITQGKYRDINIINAGDIGIISGLNQAEIGDTFGNDHNIAAACPLNIPMLTVQLKPCDNNQLTLLREAMNELCQQDPSLDVQWIAEIKELHIKITGMIQVEILQTLLQDHYGLCVEFSPPSVIYKETPANCVYGYERYWMPKPCWAIVKFNIEPAQRGAGVSYHSEVSVNKIAAKYQKEITQTIDRALQQGIKGWQVTDINITLVDGEDHNVHSRSGDFAIATPMAIMNGLLEANTLLLEPIIAFKVSASMDLLGAITSDIIKMRGSYNSPEICGESFNLTGKLPVATSIDYPITLASLSAGKAKWVTSFCCYQSCTDEQGQIIEYRGISPLDRDKWILQARGALSK